jgi:glutamyl-tRNA synthetase
MIVMNIEEEIYRQALANAVEHSGKANAGAVLGKIVAEMPEVKPKIKEIKELVEKIVKEVNTWPEDKQKSELERLGPVVKPEKVQRTGLPPLPNAVPGHVVTRFPPFPSGALHIGNMRAVITSYEYAKMYNGKFIVRIEDTDFTKFKKENIDLIKADLDAMNIKYDAFYFDSDHLDRYYELARKLIKEGKAYVCTCKAQGKEKTEKLAVKKAACSCRNRSIEENLKLFEKMFTELKEGEAVLRLKTDVNDPNPALRDPALLRIREGVHPITGKENKVYPLYNYSCAIEDHDSGVTHVLRAAEHSTNTLIQKKVYEALGWKDFPTVINFGFIYVKEAKVHKRFIRDGLASGMFKGWDDPKLARYGLVRALLRFGITPEAIRNFIISLGVNPQTIRFSWDMLFSENRKVIDKFAKRYFCVTDPVKIILDKLPTNAVSAKLHPSSTETREIPVSNEIFIERSDFQENVGKEVRLMHFCNVILNRDRSAKVTGTELKDVPKIHWVPAKHAIKRRMMTFDISEKEILCEPSVANIKPGEIVQFERVGFARLDEDGTFYSAHK